MTTLLHKRVRADLFGTGTVVKHPLGWTNRAARVLWDEPPPVQYSTTNPCTVDVELLTVLEETPTDA
jgi:hypothetical protein